MTRPKRYAAASRSGREGRAQQAGAEVLRWFTHIRALFACLVVVAVAAPAAASAARMDQAERTVVRKVNALRAASGLPALARNRRLARAADSHSRDMLRSGFFAHSSSNGRSALERVLSYRRSKRMGETLAYMPTAGQGSPYTLPRPGIGSEDIVDLWMASPPHRAVLLARRLRRIGVARRRGHLFGRSVVVWTADLASAR